MMLVLVNIKKVAPKKKKEDVNEGLLVDYALKKGGYVGTWAITQSMQVSSPTTKYVMTLALGLQPRQRACKGAGQD